MALTFGATNDRLAIPAATSINDLSSFSVLMWVFITTSTAGRRLWSKGGNSARHSRIASSDRYLFHVDRATVDAEAATANSTLVANTWQLLGFTYDPTAGPKIYVGTTSVPIVEASYGSAPTVGSGTTVADAGHNLWVGNNTEAADQPTQGRIASFAYFNAVLTLEAMQSWQWHPRALSGCVAYYQLGFPGTNTHGDWSGNGNTGTVTGSAVGAHVPQRPVFGGLAGWRGAFTAAAPAAGVVPSVFHSPIFRSPIFRSA